MSLTEIFVKISKHISIKNLYGEIFMSLHMSLLNLHVYLQYP